MRGAIVLALIVAGVARAAPRAPGVYTVPSPRRVWGLSAVDLANEPPASDGKLLFVQRPDRKQLVALEVATGRERWTAPVVADSHVMGRKDVVVTGGVVIAESADRALAAFDAASGERRWQRREPCFLEQSDGLFLLMRCRQPGGKPWQVVEAQTGARGPSFASDWQDKLVLGPRALFVWTHDTHRLRKHALVPGEPSWEIPAPSGPPSLLLVAGDVLIVGIRHQLHAFAPEDGRLLWTRDTPGGPRGPSFEPVWEDGRLFVATADALLELIPRTGAVTRRHPLPDYARRWLADLTIHVSGGRVVGSYPPRIRSYGRLLVWGPDDGAPAVLRRPQPGGLADVLVGDTFVIASGHQRTLVAYDLRTLDPPLASLSEADLSKAIDDGGPALQEDRFEILRQLPAMQGSLMRLTVEGKRHEREEAISALGDHGDPARLALFLRLASDAHVSRELLEHLAPALAAYDDPQVSAWFAAQLRAPARDPRVFTAIRDGAYDQLWRTGRTTGLGFCPAGAQPLPDLGAPAEEGTFGTAHPLVFEAHAPDGRWVALCQARADTDHNGKIEVRFGLHGDAFGDKLVPYLIVEGGPGHPMDELVGAEPTGRFVAVREGPCLRLVDTVARTATTLPDADLRDDAPAFGHHRAVSFDAAGKRMLYLRGGRLVVRELPGGSERVLDAGPGLLWRARLDPLGQAVLVEATDSRWPQVMTTLADRSCRGPAASWSTFGEDDDVTITRRIVSVEGAPTQEVPGLIMPFGRERLVRLPDGAIVAEGPDGHDRRVLVPASCEGEILHADPARQLVVGVCASEADPYDDAPVRFFDVRGSSPLRSTERVRGADSWVQSTGRFVDLGWFPLDLEARQWGSPPRGPQDVWAGPRSREGQPFLRRGDGAILLGAPPDKKPSVFSRPDRGPLVWRLPD